MIAFFIDRARGGWVLLTAALLAFSIYLLNALPWWRALIDVQDGREIQTIAFADGADVRAALDMIDAASARDVALSFYAFDVFNFTVLGFAGAAFIAFGLRRLGWAQSLARYLIAVPLIAAAADAVETVCLAACFLVTRDGFADIAPVATTLKLIAVQVAMPLSLLLVLAGLAWWSFRKLWPKAAGRGAD